jgi:hypothetical protein
MGVHLSATPLRALFSSHNQFGTNCDNGAEIAVHVCRVARDVCRRDGHRAILKFDIKNAFNCVLRRAVRSATEAACRMDLPGADALRASLSNIDAKMWEHTVLMLEDVRLSSQRGTIQGDPAGGQEFDLPLVLDVLVPLFEKYPDSIRSFYQDDGHVCAEAGELARLGVDMSVLLGGIGLELNPAKCVVYSTDPAATRAVMEPIFAEHLRGVQFLHLDTLTVLSVPLGPPSACAASVRAALSSVLDDIATISSFKHQHVALALLHDCLSFGPAVYFARLVEPSPEVLQVYEELDAVVLSALDSITGLRPAVGGHKISLDLHPDPQPLDVALWRVGCRLGGLGLRSVRRHAPLAFFACLRVVARAVHGEGSTYLPPSMRSFTDAWVNFLPQESAESPFLHPDLPDATVADSEQLWLRYHCRPLAAFPDFVRGFAMALLPIPDDASTLDMRIAHCVLRIPEKRLQRFLSRFMDGIDRKAIEGAMVADVRGLQRLRTLGGPHMACALYPVPAYMRALAECNRSTDGILLTNAQLHYALRVRLGHSLCSPHDSTCIQCGRPVTNLDDHAMHCMKGGERGRCHDAMVSGISTLLSDIGFQVQTERMLFGSQERLDIVTSIGGTKYALDVTVVSPLLGSTVKPAVVRAAEAKRAKYSAKCAAIRVQFIPAAFDMWGGKCKEFVDFLTMALRAASRIAPHLSHPMIAAHTRVAVAHHRAVGSLLAAKLVG